MAIVYIIPVLLSVITAIVLISLLHRITRGYIWIVIVPLVVYAIFWGITNGDIVFSIILDIGICVVVFGVLILITWLRKKLSKPENIVFNWYTTRLPFIIENRTKLTEHSINPEKKDAQDIYSDDLDP